MDALTLSDVSRLDDPFELFAAWLEEAGATEVNDPNAMTLATVGLDGLPDARVVLLKGVDRRGLAFFTNGDSAKGAELAANPQAAAVFHWKSLRRQVRARGGVEPVSNADADAYFASRSRDSQIGAWASRQSQPLESREVFEDAVQRIAARYLDVAVPRPPHWCGYRIVPTHLEFWCDRPHRLHERLLFHREDPHSGWAKTLLYP